MLILIIATYVAFIVKGLCGFANTICFDTITSFAHNNINISPIELLVGYPTNFVITWKERKSVSLKKSIPLILLVLAGSIPGALFLKSGDTRLLKIILGFVVIVIAAEMFLRERAVKKRKSSRILLGIIGVLSGALCGLFGIGALMAAYVSRTTENTSEFKGNICLVFCVENTVRIVTYLVTGIITLEIVKQALILLPFMLFGLVTGMRLSKIVNEETAKKMVLLFLVISGLSLILKNL